MINQFDLFETPTSRLLKDRTHETGQWGQEEELKIAYEKEVIPRHLLSSLKPHGRCLKKFKKYGSYEILEGESDEEITGF